MMLKQRKLTLREMKLKKWLLWGLLIGNCLMGLLIVFLWLSGELNINVLKKNEKENLALSNEAKAFAVHFAVDYYNWTLGQEEARVKRLQPYLPEGMDTQAGIHFTQLQREARPGAAQVWKVESQGFNQSTITIMINVTYYNPKNSQDFYTIKRWLAVPIQANRSDGFIIRNIPYVIPPPAIVHMKKSVEEVKGKVVDTVTQRQIQEVLRNFFDVYSRGNLDDIRYLTQSDKPIQGFQGLMKFLSLEDLKVIQSGPNCYAYTTVVLQEKDSSTEMMYPFEIRLRKEKNQWFVYELNHQ
ncbi:Conjugative transposon protein TcpC [Seinonella peptonophila]|uniref:Conjugative transposon protein TcpC n=1 Tax=Seinonella peptonophila TaxID=112248 RepID=A0A1M5AXL0_9BACL|nr:conjugal transfer protein [Seinonella peptonophila]SHF35014.1 Conjugative transposon protein TcpC [Seinonella peptonophila]